MLDEIQKRGFALGSNLKGGPTADPTWLFLLPEIAPDSIGHLGRRSRRVAGKIKRRTPTMQDTRLGEADLTSDLVIVTAGERSRSGLSGLNPATPVLLLAGRGDRHPWPDPVDGLASWVCGSLAPGPPGPEGIHDSGAGRQCLTLPHAPTVSHRAGGLARVAKAAAKQIDGAIGGRMENLSRRFRPRAGGDPTISLWHPDAGPVPGRAAIILPEGVSAAEPPHYLSRLAADNGHDISQRLWALAPPRGYRSQKVLFFLYRHGSPNADVVIKLTQDPEFNSRLENEARMLNALHEMGTVEAGTIPAVLFSGRVGGLAAVAETALVGEPFRQHSSGQPDCKYAAQALDWITDLGKRTARPAGGAVWEGALTHLLDQFRSFYRPSTTDDAQLRAMAALLAEEDRAVPTVFQHGDPGNWNLIVTSEDRVGFLDWESGEPNGAPLWDLFIFIKTYAAWAARSSGGGYDAEVFEQQLLRHSPFRRVLIEQTHRYCREVKIPWAVVDALFVFCWVYQSLKEVGRMRRAGPSRGSNAQIVRHCLATHRAEGELIGSLPPE